MIAKLIWLGVGLLIACFAWRASAKQTQASREITENLGKLVSVTQPSPANILVAAAAKILELEASIKDFKNHSPRTISAEQWDRMSEVFRKIRSRAVQIVVVFPEQYYEVASYGRQFAALFQHHGIGGSVLTNHVPPIPSELKGIVVRYDSALQKPEIADSLANAFKAAHIEYRMDAGPFPPELKSFCELIIGRND